MLPGWGWQGDGALAATCPPALTCASLPPAPALHQTGYLYLSDPERLHAMMGLLGLGDDDGEEEGSGGEAADGSAGGGSEGGGSEGAAESD